MPLVDQAIAYVADEGRSHHLLMSIASWSRFINIPIRVIDLGLSVSTKTLIQTLATDITFHNPVFLLAISSDKRDPKRIQAYYQKTLVGQMEFAEKVLYLDADILVVSADFINIFNLAKPDLLIASPSAWDCDLTWTYNDSCLDFLRKCTGLRNLSLSFKIANSGVWLMSHETAAVVSQKWQMVFTEAILSDDLWSKINSGASIGDQEFLTMATWQLGVAWHQLHGSYNMQIHENRMPWATQKNTIMGSHHGEALEEVKAIHYNTGNDLSILPSHIKSKTIRSWIHNQYNQILDYLTKHGVKLNIRNELI